MTVPIDMELDILFPHVRRKRSAGFVEGCGCMADVKIIVSRRVALFPSKAFGKVKRSGQSDSNSGPTLRLGIHTGTSRFTRGLNDGRRFSYLLVKFSSLGRGN